MKWQDWVIVFTNIVIFLCLVAIAIGVVMKIVGEA